MPYFISHAFTRLWPRGLILLAQLWLGNCFCGRISFFSVVAGRDYFKYSVEAEWGFSFIAYFIFRFFYSVVADNNYSERSVCEVWL